MQILHILPQSILVDYKQYLVDLLKSQKIVSHSLRVLILLDEEKECTSELPFTVRVISPQKLGSKGYSQFLRQLIKSEKIDIVHYHNTHEIKPAIWACFLKSCPLICSLYDDQQQKLSWLQKRMIKRMTVISDDLKSSFLKNRIAGRNELEVIYPGIDLSIFNGGNGSSGKGALRTQLGVNEQCFLIGYMAAFLKKKDQLTLMKAFRKVNVKHKDSMLILVGTGPEEENLIKRADEFGLSKSIVFLQAVDFKDFFNAIDLYVDCSFDNSMAQPIFNAMACGKPVILTKILGHRDLIEERKNGFLVPCGFPERIENKIMQLIANPNTVQIIREENKKYTKEHFSIDRALNSYQKLYSSK